MRSMNGSGPPPPPQANPIAGSAGAGNSAPTGGYSGAPELKHHADFLSRLLAATPSYMNELGNPPPGFFSDWLRRLVTKPPGPGGGGGYPSQIPQMPSSNPSGPSSGPGGQERNGRSPTNQSVNQNQNSSRSSNPSLIRPGAEIETPILAKRRKRTRLSDHRPSLHSHHHAGKDSNSLKTSSPGSGNLTSGSPPTIPPPFSPGSGSGNAGNPTGTGGLPPGANPFWFFPPFLPSPYTLNMNMSMNMNLPGSLLGQNPHGHGHGPGHSHSPGHGSPPISSYLGGGNPFMSDLFRADHLNLLNAHHMNQSLFPTLSQNQNQNLSSSDSAKYNGGNNGGSRGGSSGSSPSSSTTSPDKKYPVNINVSKVDNKSKTTGSVSAGISRKSSSFSISNLTRSSPSRSPPELNPGQNGSPRTVLLNNYSKSKNSSASSSINDDCPPVGGTNTGTGTGNNDTCVDLRVSGRIWDNLGQNRATVGSEKSSIFKTISAFRDPSDHLLSSIIKHNNLPLYSSFPPQLQQQQQPVKIPSPNTGLPQSQSPNNKNKVQISTSTSPLSTKYVLENLQNIYQKMKPEDQAVVSTDLSDYIKDKPLPIPSKLPIYHNSNENFKNTISTMELHGSTMDYSPEKVHKRKKNCTKKVKRSSEYTFDCNPSSSIGSSSYTEDQDLDVDDKSNNSNFEIPIPPSKVDDKDINPDINDNNNTKSMDLVIPKPNTHSNTNANSKCTTMISHLNAKNSFKSSRGVLSRSFSISVPSPPQSPDEKVDPTGSDHSDGDESSLNIVKKSVESPGESEIKDEIITGDLDLDNSPTDKSPKNDKNCEKDDSDQESSNEVNVLSDNEENKQNN